MEQHLTHWKKLVNPDYIGAYSLEDGKDLTVTITEVKREMVTGTGGKKEECTVAYLKGQKPMILNRTNCRTIQSIYKTPFVENWAGKQVTLFVSSTKLKGEDVECLRIRPVAPAKPELTPDSSKWDGAVAALRDNKTTIEAIEKAYTLSTGNKKLLLEKLIETA
jgi:hypothetical protein